MSLIKKVMPVLQGIPCVTKNATTSASAGVELRFHHAALLRKHWLLPLKPPTTKLSPLAAPSPQSPQPRLPLSCAAHLARWVATHTQTLTPTFPHARTQAPSTHIIPPHLRRHVSCLVLPWPCVPLSSSPPSTSTFHFTVTCDRPAMWDSRYCPSLLSPSHPSSPTSLPSIPLPSPSSSYLLPRPPSPSSFLHPSTPHREWPAIPCMVWQREVLFNLWR